MKSSNEAVSAKENMSSLNVQKLLEKCHRPGSSYLMWSMHKALCLHAMLFVQVHTNTPFYLHRMYTFIYLGMPPFVHWYTPILFTQVYPILFTQVYPILLIGIQTFIYIGIPSFVHIDIPPLFPMYFKFKCNGKLHLIFNRLSRQVLMFHKANYYMFVHKICASHDERKVLKIDFNTFPRPFKRPTSWMSIVLI